MKKIFVIVLACFSLGFVSDQDIETEMCQSGCCKVCRHSKACGNSCIPRDRVCHKGPGCACDAW